MNLRGLSSIPGLLLIIIMMATVFSCSSEVDAPHISSNDSLMLAGLREQSMECENIDEAVVYAKKELELAKSLHSGVNEVNVLLYMFSLYYDHGKNEEALSYATQASQIADSINDKPLLAKSYWFLGVVLSRFKNNPIAAKNFAQAFGLYLGMNDMPNVVNAWRDLIPAYLNANLFDSARSVCDRCLEMDSIMHNDRGVVESTALYGTYNLAKFRSNAVDPDYIQLDSAHMMLRKAEIMNRRINDPKTRKIIYMGLTETFYNLSFKETDPKRRRELADSGRIYLPEACIIANNTGVAEVIHRINIIGVKIHYLAGDMKATKRFVDSLVVVANKKNTYIDRETACRAQSLYSAYRNDFDSAFAYRVLAEKNREVINYSDNSFLLSVQLAKSQTDEERNSAKSREGELMDETKRQKSIIMYTVLGVTLLLGAGIMLFRSFRKTKQLNEKINAINEEMRVQSEEIRVKNDEIMDGISYASIIQFAAMPSVAEMKHTFGDCLVYLSARNVVSGDFYWASEDVSGRYKLLAVGDCTGHGVPGALLSMLGMSILDYTTRHFGVGEISAGIVLDKMRNNFKRTLNQTSFSTDKTVDSIDIVLLVFDTQDKTLHYAAAFRPLLIFRFGEMMRMKADSMPIGIYPREKPHFTDNVMKLCKGDIVYLYSDGMTDQDGYEDAAAQYPRAYSSKQFFKVLKNNFQRPFSEQEVILRESREEWRRPKSDKQVECELTDDATIIGVAVNNFIKFDDL